MFEKFRILVLKGLQPYNKMLEKQWTTWANVKQNKTEPTLYLLQHSPVITLGRRFQKKSLLLSYEELKNKQINIVPTERGGSITYHGPGQLVGYIICKVSAFGGIYDFVLKILKFLVDILKSFEINAYHSLDFPGVWISDFPLRKIGAVGIQVKEGYSLHGFALNVDMNLNPFTYIVPCDIKQPITTMSLELKKQVTISNVIQAISSYETSSSQK